VLQRGDRRIRLAKRTQQRGAKAVARSIARI
jgi:hypothetical protein